MIIMIYHQGKKAIGIDVKKVFVARRL